LVINTYNACLRFAWLGALTAEHYTKIGNQLVFGEYGPKYKIS